MSNTYIIRYINISCCKFDKLRLVNRQKFANIRRLKYGESVVDLKMSATRCCCIKSEAIAFGSPLQFLTVYRSRFVLMGSIRPMAN